MPTQLAAIRREHVEAFIEDLIARWKPTTAANRYSGVQAFFNWAVDEGEIRESPMAKIRKPRLPEIDGGTILREVCAVQPSSASAPPTGER